MSLQVIKESTPTSNQIQFKNIYDFDEKNRFEIIDSINKSLNDNRWEKDTAFIARKYLFHPKNYQVFLIAELFKQAIGYLIIRDDNKEKMTSYLSFVVVHAKHQNTGIGQALLSFAVKIIQEMGVQKMILDCEKTNCSFYEKFAKKSSFSHSITKIGQYSFGKEKIQITINFS